MANTIPSKTTSPLHIQTHLLILLVITAYNK